MYRKSGIYKFPLNMILFSASSLLHPHAADSQWSLHTLTFGVARFVRAARSSVMRALCKQCIFYTFRPRVRFFLLMLSVPDHQVTSVGVEDDVASCIFNVSLLRRTPFSMACWEKRWAVPSLTCGYLGRTPHLPLGSPPHVSCLPQQPRPLDFPFG